jgi:hypothetical protein
MVLRELVRECALEAGEVVFEVREDALAVVELESLSCEPTMVDSMTEDRAPEDDAFVFVEERLQVLEDRRLRLERAGKAVQKTVQPDGAEAGRAEFERLEDVGPDDPGGVARQAPRRLAEAGLAQIEERELRPLSRKTAAVEEVAGADADVEMAGARVALVEREEVPLRAAPDEPA